MRLLAFILRLLTPWTWWNLSSEPVPEPVPVKSSANSKASTANIPDNVVRTRTTEPVPEPVPPLQPCPSPEAQAQALLEWLHAHNAGEGLRAGHVEKECYPKMLAEQGWRPRPWTGRNGVGKHLTRLMGGKRRTGYTAENANGKKKRARGYFIPRVIEVRKRA